MTHDYKRHGTTTTLFAALDVLTGAVVGECLPRHRHDEFLTFLTTVDRQTPKGLEIHMILDNYATHKHPGVVAWLTKHPRFHLHFTPTSSSWLNLVTWLLQCQRGVSDGGRVPLHPLVKATNMDLGLDRSTVDALSWRLASELYRRQPDQSTLNRGHPGGGLYDCLMIFGSNGSGSIMLNRVGTIQGHSRFDGRGDGDWRATTWEEYMRADPRRFLLALEDAAGLRPAGQTPPSSPATLVYRVLAVLTALASKSMRPYSVEQAYIDSSGDDGGPNDAIEAFPLAAAELRRAREAADLLTEPGFRYWMVWQHHDPLCVFNRDSGEVWTPKAKAPLRLQALYSQSGHAIEKTALRLLERIQP